MRRDVGAGALAALLLASGIAVAAWDQAGGGPGHPGLVEGLPDTLDVVGIRLTEDARTVTQAFGPGSVATPAGLAYAWHGGLADCHLELLASSSGEARNATVECEAIVTLVGYDAASDLIVLCTPTVSGAPLVQAFEAATLARRWSHTIDEPAVRPDDTANVFTAWRCDGALIDTEARLVVAPFARSADQRSEVAAISIEDGSLTWRTPLSVFPDPTSLSPVAVPDARPGNGFLAESVTRTESGYVVVGTVMAGATPAEAAYFTLDLAGVSRSFYAVPVEPTNDRFNPVGHSSTGAASERVAALVMGNAILAVDPTVDEATSTPFDPGPAPTGVGDAFRSAAPAWWTETNTLLVPTHGGIRAFRTPGMEPIWNWSAGPGSRTTQVAIAPPGDAYALARRTEQEVGVLTLSRLDLRSGAEVQRLRFDAPELLDATQNARLAPWAAERVAVVMKPDGRMLFLGEADASDVPRATPSTFYPEVDHHIDLLVEADGAQRAVVAWGDGTVVETDVGATLRYQFGDARDRQVRVTVSYADGRTATSALTLHVGQQDPGALTPMQRAFSPQNQNLTFFLIGLAVTGGGALFAALLRRRRHSRLAEEEALLRQVIDASLLEPSKGIAALEAHRARLRDQHTRRRIDDAQFGLLDQRTVRAMKSARYRLLGSALNRLTPHFRRVLDTALEDGQVTQGEMSALIAELDGESALSSPEREKMRALLSSWAR